MRGISKKKIRNKHLAITIAIATITAPTVATMSDEMAKPLVVFTTSNFIKLCVIKTNLTAGDTAKKAQIAELYLNAANIPYSRLLTDTLSGASKGDSDTKLVDIMRSVLETKKTVVVAKQSREVGRIANSIGSLENDIRELRQDLAKKVNGKPSLTPKEVFEHQLTLIEKSFHLWAFTDGLKGKFPYRLKSAKVKKDRGTAPKIEDLKAFLMKTSSSEVIAALLSNDATLQIGCTQTFTDKADLSSKFRIRKNAENLRHAVNSSKAAGAELTYSRTRSVELDTDNEIVSSKSNTKLAFDITLGYSLFDNHKNLFLYTSFSYKDSDEKTDRINTDNQENRLACEAMNIEEIDCLVDSDRRQTIKYGVIGVLPAIPLLKTKLVLDLFSIQDLVFNSETYTGKLTFNLSDNTKLPLFNDGQNLGSDFTFALNPKVWTQFSYIADAGTRGELRNNILANGNGSEDYLGFGVGGSASLQWQAFTFGVSYHRLFVPSDRINNQKVYTLSAAYAFPNIRNTSIKFGIEKGIKLDSLTPVDELGLSIAFKY